MHKLLSLAAALLIGLGSFQAVAQTVAPKLEQRLETARTRVFQGIRDGYLTRAEADRLNRDLDRVDRILRQSRRDGVATTAERRDVRDALVPVENEIDRLTRRRR